MSGRRRAAARIRLDALLLGVLLLGATAARADTHASAGADAEQGTELSFSADRMETVQAQGRERTVLTGAAWLTVDGTTIRADSIELFGEDLTLALCRGSVRVIDEEQNIELASDELFFDRERSLLRIQGAALLIDRDNEIVVKGGFLQYDQDAGEAVVQIGVRILKSDLVSRSEFARYRREQNTVELSGMPVVTYQGDRYRAMRIFIDLDRDAIRLDGAIRGTIKVS